MKVVRVAVFDQPVVQEDDERRSASPRDLLRNAPGFIAGYHLREESTGRLMSFTVWDSDEALELGEQAVRARRLMTSGVSGLHALRSGLLMQSSKVDRTSSIRFSRCTNRC